MKSSLPLSYKCQVHKNGYIWKTNKAGDEWLVADYEGFKEGIEIEYRDLDPNAFFHFANMIISKKSNFRLRKANKEELKDNFYAFTHKYGCLRNSETKKMGIGAWKKKDYAHFMRMSAVEQLVAHMNTILREYTGDVLTDDQTEDLLNPDIFHEPIEVKFEHDEENYLFNFVMKPQTLWTALLVQCMSSINNREKIKRCKCCFNLFMPQRSDGYFCTDNCRNKWHKRNNKPLGDKNET